MKKKFILFITLLILISCSVSAATVKQRIAKNVKRANIVLAGSSSLSRWKNAKSNLYPYSIANISVGGTKINEWQKYNYYITKCKPKVIIVSIGGNDIRSKSANEIAVSKKVIKFLKTLSANNPKAKIFYVSVHPNSKRWSVWNKVKRFNNEVKKWCKNKKKIEFIDITNYCLKNGKPDKSLFISDRLHFNTKGYNRVWKNVVAKKVKNYLK